jgi:hypothetical protein
MMEAVSTSETSVNFYQTTRRNIPEDSHLIVFKNVWCEDMNWIHLAEDRNQWCVVELVVP